MCFVGFFPEDANTDRNKKNPKNPKLLAYIGVSI